MNANTDPDFDGVPLDTKTISQDRLNIDNKARSNFFPWNGQFSPQLVEVLLRTYATSDAFVLDPFLGSGTVLNESGRLGHPAFGSEINPAAFKMASVYRFLNVETTKRRIVIAEVSDILHETLPSTPSLFAPAVNKSATSIPQLLVHATSVENSLCKTLA